MDSSRSLLSTKNVNSKLSLTGAFVALLLFIPLALHTYLADSEIWSISVSKNFFFPNLGNSGLYAKPLFYLLLTPLHYLGLESPEHFLAARAFFSLIGVGILVLTYQVTLKITENKTAALLSSLLLMSDSFFLSRGFRVRSDLLVSLVHLFFMKELFSARPIETKSRILIGYSVAMLLATPKALYFLISSWVLAQTFEPRISGCLVGRNVRGKLLSAFIFIAILYSAYRQSALYYINSLLDLDVPVPYLSATSWSYLLRWVRENPFLILSLLGSIGLFFQKQASGKIQLWIRFSILMFLFVLIHPEKYPFFIASFVPTFSVCVGVGYAQVAKNFTTTATRIATVVLTFLLVGSLLFNYKRLWTENGNTTQTSIIKKLQELIKDNPNLLLFDGIGLLPEKSTVLIHIGPFLQETKSQVFERLIAYKPDLIFYTNRMKNLEPELGQLLSRSYVELSKDIYAKNINISLSDLPNELLKKTGYIYQNDEWKPYRDRPWKERKVDKVSFQPIKIIDLLNYLKNGKTLNVHYKILGHPENSTFLLSKDSDTKKVDSISYEDTIDYEFLLVSTRTRSFDIRTKVNHISTQHGLSENFSYDFQY